MPQLHLYLPEKEARVIRAQARARKMPVSRYLAEIVRKEIHHGWPEGFFENVAGAWKDTDIERPEQGEYEEREPF